MAEQASYEARYRRLRAEFEDFLYDLPEGFLEADLRTQRITRLNRVACLLLGFDPENPPDDLHGRDILVEGELDRLYAYHLDLIRPALESGVPYRRLQRQPPQEARLRRADGEEFIAEFQASYVLDEARRPVAVRFIFHDVTARKEAEEAQTTRIRQLERLLPICAWCYRIRDEHGEWHLLEAYLHRYVGYDFTHSICPDCESRIDF